ncbi:hypothetical protein RB195_012150 [Necator americanus]|uniref:Potassium channel domain-containing protein n=1 Tax=Necator americanus TaxID=51031 RepID=A0ABR1D6N9_NECAM
MTQSCLIVTNFSRPTSAQSGTSLGSKIRFSFDSLLSRPDHPELMLGRRSSCLQHEEFLRARKPPQTWLGKAKYYYDKYNCRYFAPFLLLFFYSLLGAWVFYIVENENEKEMKIKEEWDLNWLRNHTFNKIVGVFQARRRIERASKSRDVLLWYEKELQRVKLPEALEWDMWGALFYVGTIFTTIGYGNIFPRTITGRALSVVYAIIGIPLVLAILSRFGQFLEHTITRAWLRHRERIKKTPQMLRSSTRTKSGKSPEELEEGKLKSPTSSEFLEEHLIEDSRTIPIWLALLFCLSWICACAALFLIWEKRWTFFTSLYFFFISLSTIGLGDVVPDHPHMLILMFWLVIIGLSIVSMLLTVIQIKFEECLYNLMIRIQEEYHRNLANGTPFDHAEICKKAMERQPLFMKLFGPDMMSDDQKEKIEEKVEQFERVVRITNNKNVQTDTPLASVIGTQMENVANSIACDPMSESDRVLMANGETQWSRQFQSTACEEPNSEADDHDSMSDATSLPMDSTSYSARKYTDRSQKKVAFCTTCANRENSTRSVAPKEPINTVDEPVQTDIAQFQIDEIVLRLAALQSNRVRPDVVDRGSTAPRFRMGRRAKKRSQPESVEEKSVKDMTDNEILNTMLQVMQQSLETDASPPKSTKELGVNTVPNSVSSCGVSTYPISRRTQSIETDPHDVTNRSVATDNAILLDKSMETSRSERDPTNMSWDEKRRHDMMTSPIIRRLMMKTSAIGSDSSYDADDRSQQTSIAIDPPRKGSDRSQQTSLMIDRPCPDVDRSLQTSPSVEKQQSDRSIQSAPDCMDRMTSPILRESFNRSFQTPPDEVTNRSQQTSLDMLDKTQETSRAELVSQCVGTDPEPGGYNPITDWPRNSVSMYEGRMTDSMETSTQYSPPMSRSVTAQQTDTDYLTVPGMRTRSSSTCGLGTSIHDDESRQEVIIQTDDSYLKIARRLDEYRSNRTQFLPVVAASPLGSRDIEPFKTDRPSERRGFYVDMKDLLQRRRSSKARRRMSHKINNAEAQTGSSMDKAQLEPIISGHHERSRSISPETPPRPRRVLARVASLPAGVARGKVGEFVAKHERGIPNPAVGRDRPVRIVRQYAMVDKGT